MEYLQKGEKLYKEKNYREALNHFKEALEENPNSTKANLGFAKTSLALGSLGDASNSYKFVLNAEPNHKEAITGYSEVLSLQGKNKEALAIIEEALKQEPYNRLLLLQKSSILLRMKRNKTALKFLESIRNIIEPGYDYQVILSRAYIANEKYKNATDTISELARKFPDNPEIFYEKARMTIELANKENDSEKVFELMSEARDLLITSISLDPDYTLSKRLLVKNYMWLGDYEEASRICEEILDKIPSDIEMLYYSAYLNSKLDKSQNAGIYFGKLLKLQEINAFARQSAENFAIKNLNEKHPLRTNLGRYRLDQYEKDVHDFYYKNASFHIHKALDLFPENIYLKNKLADFYYKRGDRKRLIQILLNLRENDPDDIKINNRLEAILKRMRDSLSYREGYLEKDSSLIEGIRTEPDIYIFDLKPEGFIPEVPDSSKIVTDSIKYAISLLPEVKLIASEEEANIRSSIIESYGKARFTESLYYSADAVQKLNEFRKRDSLIRYIGYGSFKAFDNTLSIDFNLYDRATGKIIKNVKLSSFGRNRISEISVRLADTISKSILREGKVLKVKKDSIIINMGFRDGFKKGDLVSIESDGNVLAVCELNELDEYISSVIVKESKINWKKEIGEGFYVKQIFLPKKEKSE